MNSYENVIVVKNRLPGPVSDKDLAITENHVRDNHPNVKRKLVVWQNNSKFTLRNGCLFDHNYRTNSPTTTADCMVYNLKTSFWHQIHCTEFDVVIQR